jgi:hypothetical protein
MSGTYIGALGASSRLCMEGQSRCLDLLCGSRHSEALQTGGSMSNSNGRRARTVDTIWTHPSASSATPLMKPLTVTGIFKNQHNQISELQRHPKTPVPPNRYPSRSRQRPSKCRRRSAPPGMGLFRSFRCWHWTSSQRLCPTVFDNRT